MKRIGPRRPGSSRPDCRGVLATARFGALTAAFLLATGATASARTAANLPAVESGAKVYGRWCAECHNARGFGTTSLQRRYNGALPAILDQRRNLSEDYIRHVVRNGQSFMPFFRKTEITDAELASVVAYLTRDRAAPIGERSHPIRRRSSR